MNAPMSTQPGQGIRIDQLRKRYGSGDTAVDALKNVNMTVAPGEVVGLIGPSGSGKSTLLKCLGAIIEPSAGRMTLGGDVIYDDAWKAGDLRALRRDRIGFVFQAPYLIPFLDVTDNVALLPMLAGVPNAQARQRARELLDALDVGHRARAQPSQLSGGEQQRVAIARALVNRPPVILADEPTAPLDSERALAVIRILNTMAQQFQTAVIVVTHDEKIIPTFRRIYQIRDGQTVEEAGAGRAIYGVSLDPCHAALQQNRLDWHQPLGLSQSALCTHIKPEHETTRQQGFHHHGRRPGHRPGHRAQIRRRRRHRGHLRHQAGGGGGRRAAMPGAGRHGGRF